MGKSTKDITIFYSFWDIIFFPHASHTFGITFLFSPIYKVNYNIKNNNHMFEVIDVSIYNILFISYTQGRPQQILKNTLETLGHR